MLSNQWKAVIALACCSIASGMAWAGEMELSLDSGAKFELRRNGVISTTLDSNRSCERGDLIRVKENQVYLVTNSGGRLTLGPGSLVWLDAAPEGELNLKVYRGGAEFEGLSSISLEMNGAKVFCLDGAAGWLTADAIKSKFTLTQGSADVFATNEIRALAAGETLLLEEGRAVLSRSADMKGENLLSEDGLKRHLGEVGIFEDRYQKLGKGSAVASDDVKKTVLNVVNVFHRYRWRALLEKGREHLLAQEWLGLMDSWPILPQSMKKHFLDKHDTDALFDEMALIDDQLSGLSKTDKNLVSFFTRQSLSEELLTKRRWLSGVTGRYNILMTQDSNVSETPDGNPSVSGQSGASLTSDMKLTYTGRRLSWGSPVYEIRYMDRTFFDDQFEPREFNQVAGVAKAVFELKNKGIQSITPSFQLKGEFINSKQGRDPNVITYGSKLELVFMPKQEWGSHSDLFLNFLTLGLDQRDYVTGKNIDRFGKDKDVWSPSITWVGVNILKVEGWRWSETVVVGLRHPMSDSDNFEYFGASFDGSIGFEKERWELKPSLAYRHRDQSSYDLAPRRDNTMEWGFLVTKKMPEERMDLRGGYRRIYQDSSQTNFKFGDHRWTLGLSKNF